MAQTSSSSAVLAPSSVADQAWIAAELGKGIDAERTLSSQARDRGDSPPDPALGVLYFEIAAADERHAAVIERIATRYGHTPLAPPGSGIGEALGQIKDHFAKLGSSPMDQLRGDLQGKSRSVHWLTAWAHALETIGDAASARELLIVVEEEQAHTDALQHGLNRMIALHASGTVAG
jgi:bacterioferritin (cytochrome b1)